MVVFVVDSCVKSLSGRQSAGFRSAGSRGHVLPTSWCCCWVLASRCPPSCAGVFHICVDGRCIRGRPCLRCGCDVLRGDGRIMSWWRAAPAAAAVVRRLVSAAAMPRCCAEQKHLSAVAISILQCFQTVSSLSVQDVAGIVPTASGTHREVCSTLPISWFQKQLVICL